MMPAGSRYKPVLIHILIWIAYSIFTYFVNWVQDFGRNVYVLDTIGKSLIASFIFYFNVLFSLPYLFKRKKYIYYACSLILLSFTSFFCKQFLYLKVFPLFGYPQLSSPWIRLYIMNLSWLFEYTLFGFGYWFALEVINKEKEKVQLERDKLQAEYAYLKAQVNPHFLYNVLNFFYAKAIQVSEPLADGILYLADIMRYVLSNEEDDKGQILLSIELEQILNMININQLRFDNKLKINFVTEGRYEEVRIIPFVIVALVENAFKHGELLDTDDPLLIIVSFIKSENTIHVLIKNRKLKSHDNRSSGIGLVNINRRLSYAYPNRHSLVIDNDSDFYTVNLTIKL